MRQNYLDVFEQQESMKNAVEDRKIKKFFRIAIPILIIELIVVIVLGIYLIILPKDFCTISVNLKDAKVYLNNKETSKFRLNPPNKKLSFYNYDANVSILLPGSDTYNVTFTMNCEKYKVVAVTTAIRRDGVYYMEINGGVKTQLFSGITIIADELIEDYDVEVKVFAEKI